MRDDHHHLVKEEKSERKFLNDSWGGVRMYYGPIIGLGYVVGYVQVIAISLVILLTYFLLVAALQSLDLLLSYPTTTLASHIT